MRSGYQEKLVFLDHKILESKELFHQWKGSSLNSLFVTNFTHSQLLPFFFFIELIFMLLFFSFLFLYSCILLFNIWAQCFSFAFPIFPCNPKLEPFHSIQLFSTQLKINNFKSKGFILFQAKVQKGYNL